ncbi:MAG: hypothetical protein IBJ15_02060 [Alphaproteobacteria bacterium]|nr:hypothetical protein [Alphaproteobacteria bacterium]
MNDPIEHGLALTAFVARIANYGSAVALVVTLLFGFLALVRTGNVQAPWAKRWFLTPIDRLRERRASARVAAEEGVEQAPLPTSTTEEKR